MHDQALGQGIAGAVVVADDDLDPGALEGGDLVEVGHAAVDREEQVGTLGVFRHAVGVDAVPVGEAVGDEGRDVGAQFPQAQGQQGGPGDSVRVVIAVDEDAAAVADGVLQALGRGREVGDAGGLELRAEVLERVVP